MVEGEPFEVQELHYREDEEKVAYVKKVVVDYFTDAVSAKGVWILQRFTRQETPGLVGEQGEVLVAEKVVGFKKIKISTMENVGSGEVERHQQARQTTAAWLTIDPALLAEISSHRDELVDGLRALPASFTRSPHLSSLRYPRYRRLAGDGSPAAEDRSSRAR
jgi:DEAD/DEAH box helicase domain-containing protein